MKKITICLISFFTLSVMVISCSDETEVHKKSLSVEEFRQKCMKMATQYGIEVIFNNEYIMERIDWSDERLRDEMKQVAAEFEHRDSIDSSLGKEHLRRTLGGYEQGTWHYKTVDSDFSVSETIGFNTYNLTGHIQWNENGPAMDIIQYDITCVHNCGNDTCSLYGTHTPTQFNMIKTLQPLPYYYYTNDGKIELYFYMFWDATFGTESLSVTRKKTRFSDKFNYTEHTL